MALYRVTIVRPLVIDVDASSSDEAALMALDQFYLLGADGELEPTVAHVDLVDEEVQA